MCLRARGAKFCCVIHVVLQMEDVRARPRTDTRDKNVPSDITDLAMGWISTWPDSEVLDAWNARAIVQHQVAMKRTWPQIVSRVLAS